MKVTVTSTDQFIFVDGKRTRVWRGVESDTGAIVTMFVARIGIDRKNREACSRADTELEETGPSGLYPVDRAPSPYPSSPNEDDPHQEDYDTDASGDIDDDFQSIVDSDCGDR